MIEAGRLHGTIEIISVVSGSRHGLVRCCSSEAKAPTNDPSLAGGSDR